MRSRFPLAPSRITSWDQQIILVCQEGFQSSLAAAALNQLGLINATDLDGGCLRDPESRAVGWGNPSRKIVAVDHRSVPR